MADTIDGTPAMKKKRKSVVSTIKNLFKRHVYSASSVDESISAEPSLMIQSDAVELSSISSRLKTEEAWMQAIYNAQALLYIFIIGCVLVAVYYILEPFLHALIWAVLVGMVLHPFKYACTSKITECLRYTQSNNLPLSLTIFFTPFILLSLLSAKLDEFVRKHFRTIVLIAICELAFFIVSSLNIAQILNEIGVEWHHLMPYYKSLVQAPFLISVVMLSLGIATVSLCNSTLAKILSSILWLILLLLASHQFCGALALALVMCAYAAAVIFWCFPRKKRDESVVAAPKSSVPDDNAGSSESSIALSASKTSLVVTDASNTQIGEKTSLVVANGSNTQTGKGGMEGSGSSLESLSSKGGVDTDKASRAVSFQGLESASKTSLISSEGTVDEEVAVEFSAASGQDNIDGPVIKRPRLRSHKKSAESAIRARESNNFVFVVLIVSTIFVCVWKYALFQIFFAFLLLLLLGRSVYPYIQSYVRETAGKISALFVHKKEVFFPPPVVIMGRAYFHVDRMVLTLAIQSVGSIVTTFIIVGLLTSVFVVSVMVLLQIQVELSQYLVEGVVLWNKTMSLNPDMNQWVGDLGIESNSLEAAVQYGRGFLKNKLNSLLAESDNQSMVVEQVMGIFDNLYNKYFLKPVSTPGQVFNISASSSFFSLREFFSENLEIIFSVLQSLGAIVTANISVALSIFYAFLHILFSGGTALVNMIVFATALFYLLNLSVESYLPVQWVMELIPQLSEGDRGGSKQGEPFQRAIRSVFYTSFRRAGFYGLYIWLTHTVMGVSASVLPSVLGALAAAVPFVQPYWVFVLAVLELWLIKGELFLAVAMLLLMLLPEMFIYSLINEEIEGAHPYLTGLAIAGGIYFAGLEGALIGPMLLCCLLCFVDIYEDIFNN